MKMILDLDTGIDDALAIAYTLGQKDIELLGITTVFGNIDVLQAAKNTKYILQLLERPEIPVYIGSSHARGTDKYEQKRGGEIFHGKNGFANLTVADNNATLKQNAVNALVDAAKKYGKNLIIVATGPLTNIANAILKDTDAMQGIKELVIMGGAFGVRGNVSPYAEANISQDVDAANKVFTSNIPITMVGLDVTLRTLLTRNDIELWKSRNKTSLIFYELVDYYLKAHELISPHLKGCAIHDPLAVGAAIRKEYINTYSLCVCVSQNDDYGRIIIDQNRMNERANRNVKVALDINTEEFKSDFLQSLSNVLKLSYK